MNPPDLLPPFPGFRPEALAFLRALATHNEREWFKPRKTTYDDEIVWPMKCLVADVSQRCARLGLPLSADPDRAIFRIYRDTRFSKDKRPYKTSVGAVLSRGGRRDDGLGVLYVHLEPAASFVAAGFWEPERPFLNAFRAALAERPEPFLEVVADLEAQGLQVGPEEALKRLPRGFEGHADSEVAPYLKWKSFLASRRFADAEVEQPALAEAVARFAERAAPFLEYGWRLADAAETPAAGRPRR